MDIEIFETFLKSQREGFTTFLKGCSDLSREKMRYHLTEHNTEMTVALITAYPIVDCRSFSTPFTSPTPVPSVKRTTLSTLKSPDDSFRAQSPPRSNRPFKAPGPVPEVPELTYTRRPSVFKRRASTTSTTPVNTPNSKKSTDARSSSKISSHVRTPSRGGWRGGMTVGGAGRLFKMVTPRGKGHATADNSDSSAGSPISTENHPKRAASFKKDKKSTTPTPTSPFEVAARKAEHKHVSYDSDSTSDFEIALPKSTVRKVGSARSQKEKVTRKKAAGGKDAEVMGTEHGSDGIWEDKDETPSKKQKVSTNRCSPPRSTIQLD